MNLRFASILEQNTTAYLGKTSAVVYLAGCPLRCPWCNTPQLLTQENCGTASTRFFLSHFSRQRKHLNAVVFLGGEPLMQGNALLELARPLKQRGFAVKVETAGFYAEELAALLPFVDYIAFDVKTRFDEGEYARVCGFDGSPEVLLSNVLRSLAFLEARGGHAFKEIRFTVVPGLNDSEEGVCEVCARVRFADLFVLQQFRNEGELVDSAFKQKPNTALKKMLELGQLAKKELEGVDVLLRFKDRQQRVLGKESIKEEGGEPELVEEKKGS